MPGLSYDDSGSLAAYFGLTFLSLILVPSTIYAVRSGARSAVGASGGKAGVGKGGNPGKAGQAGECACEDCERKMREMEAFKRRNGKAARMVPGRRTTLLLLGWALAGFLAWRIYVAPPTGVTVYNPFEILGIAESATDKQIKKHYKLLSLKFHPDKVKLGVNETREDADAKFVELTKAYKSLTDEAIRDNLRLYGNPDGVQQREEKIAIPSWVVEGKNGAWVLAAYGLSLGGGIPFLVGRWWFSQKQITKDGALNTTAELFFHSLFDDITLAQLIALLACALEFRALLGLPGGKEDKSGGGGEKMAKKDRRAKAAQTDELEKVVAAKVAEAGLGEVLGVGNFPSTAASRRAAALLWSQLLRVDEISQQLKDERTRVLLALPKILNSLLNISLAHHWLSTTQLIMSLSGRLVQATPRLEAPLAQLPGIDLAVGTQAGRADERLREQGWQRAVAALDSEERDKLEVVLGKEGVLPAANEANKGILRRVPLLEVSNVSFKVDGERNITPGSFVNLVYHARVIDPFVTPSSEQSANGKAEAALPNGKEGSDESEESDAEANEKTTVLGVPGTERLKSEKARDKGKDAKAVDTGFAHAPRWPAHRKPHWWVMIGDPVGNRIVVQPQRISDIPVPTAANPEPEAKEFKMQFQAPPEAHTYNFEAYWISDTYVGVNVSKVVELEVDSVAQAPEDDEDDISDPEEDTLAGQMAAMRGGRVKKAADGEDEDDEEGSEEEDESSDEDGPKGKAAADSSDSDSD